MDGAKLFEDELWNGSKRGYFLSDVFENVLSAGTDDCVRWFFPGRGSQFKCSPVVE